MIRIVIFHETKRVKKILGQIRITRESYELSETDELAGYSVRIAVDRGKGLGLYQKSISGFLRKKLNVLGLIQAALDELDFENLELDDDACLSSDMERRQPRRVRPIQAKER